MKPAMIRTMDSQGRIIIPHEIRRTMNLSGGDTIEICTVENGVLLSKYKSASAGDRSMKKYLNILYSVTRCGAAICTEDQVIVSKGLCVMEGTTISEPLQDYIRCPHRIDSGSLQHLLSLRGDVKSQNRNGPAPA